MNNITIPDLDNDEITYRFINATSGGLGWGRNQYDIMRQINGGPEEWIGTVRKTGDSTWNSPAEWTATGRDDDAKRSVRDDTRLGAAKRLESALQPPEYHQRKHDEYMARMAEEQAEQAQRRADAATQRAELEELRHRLGFGTVTNRYEFPTIEFSLYEIRRMTITRDN